MSKLFTDYLKRFSAALLSTEEPSSLSTVETYFRLSQPNPMFKPQEQYT